jgi:hypothetical protein
MTDQEKIAAVDDALDGLTIEQGQLCRVAAAKYGVELMTVQNLVKELARWPTECLEELRREAEKRMEEKIEALNIPALAPESLEMETRLLKAGVRTIEPKDVEP